MGAVPQPATLTILVIEDAPEWRDATARALQAAGYTVLTAATGAEGLRLAHTTVPDLILLDVVLPDVDGFALCRQIQETPALQHSLVILVFESDTGPEDQTEGLTRGADGYLVRSISIRDLLAQVELYARIHHSERRLRAGEAHCRLQQPELRYRTLFETMAQGVVYQDATGQIITANPAAERILGLSLDQMQGRTSADPRWRAIHEDGSPFLPDEHPSMRALRASEPVRGVVMGVCNPQRDALTWIRINTMPQFLPGEDKPYGVYATFEDITERKQTEEALRENEYQYRNLANAGLALIWTAGTDGLCNYFNDPWLTFTGRTLEQEMGNGWAEGVHPDDFDRCLDTYVTAFEKREPFEMEYRLRNAHGEYRIILDMGTPNFNTKGEFIGYIGHCFDITERKQAEEALTAQLEELQRWHEVTLGREMRVIDLKREVNALLAALGQPARYASATAAPPMEEVR
jgi:PAS domain S-box-containing protein